MRSLLRRCPLLVVLGLLFGAGPALAGKRVALVLANSADQHAPSLANPVNDGVVMAKMLKEAGFESRHDLPAPDIRRVLRDFADAARDADIAVVHYAGHGIEVEGANYLIPVDVRLESTATTPVVVRSIAVAVSNIAAAAPATTPTPRCVTDR